MTVQKNMTLLLFRCNANTSSRRQAIENRFMAGEITFKSSSLAMTYR